jgi:manganese/zinc/iron transport system permease protein
MIDDFVELLRHNYNFVVVLCGVSLLGAGAGIVGAFAVLRRRALTGDALSHAALPGVCIAFLILGERNLSAMLLGALVSGIIGVATISALVRWTRVKGDAAIGIVLSVSFAIGIVLVVMILQMGEGGIKSGLMSFIFGKATNITGGDVWVIFGAAAVCLAAILLLYKEFRAVSFDADFTRSLGWPVYAIDLLLMSLVAAAVVIGLPTVGVILISALLIMPGASARFWTDRLNVLLGLSAAFGFFTGVVGTTLSYTLANLPTGPVIVLSGTALFLVSMLLGARRGVIARVLDHWKVQRQWQERQLLWTIYDLLEGGGFRRKTLPHSVLARRRAWPPRQIQRLVKSAAAGGLVVAHGSDQIELTPAGWQRAVEVTRGQRLWEAFLSEYPEQAGSMARLASGPLADQVPAAVVQELQSHLQSAGRWPREATA